jgi:hypothetical protein
VGARAAAIGARIRRHITQAAIALALEILKELKRNTPVDTGHARRNWIGSVGSPNTTEVTAETDSGIAEILAFKLGDGALWIATVVDYVLYLNYGSSDQRPAGWIERAIDVAFLRTQAKLAKAGRTDFDVGALRDEWIRSEWEAGNTNIAGIGLPD